MPRILVAGGAFTLFFCTGDVFSPEENFDRNRSYTGRCIHSCFSLTRPFHFRDSGAAHFGTETKQPEVHIYKGS